MYKVRNAPFVHQPYASDISPIDQHQADNSRQLFQSGTVHEPYKPYLPPVDLPLFTEVKASYDQILTTLNTNPKEAKKHLCCEESIFDSYKLKCFQLPKSEINSLRKYFGINLYEYVLKILEANPKEAKEYLCHKKCSEESTLDICKLSILCYSLVKSEMNSLRKHFGIT